MAILEKRRAVNQLPRFQRYQDTRAGDRAAALRGKTPITSAISQLAGLGGLGPIAGGAGPMGNAGKGTVDKFGNMAGQPKTAVASALKSPTAATQSVGTTAAGTTSKLPGLASKVAGTTGTAGGAGAKTLTSTGTGAAKVTGATSPTTTGTKTGSSVGSKLTSALTGAALGAGTKLVIDKLTGKKTAGNVPQGSPAATNTTKASPKVTDPVAKVAAGAVSKTGDLIKAENPASKGDDVSAKSDGNAGEKIDTKTNAKDTEEPYNGLYADDEGNLYDAEGNLFQYADGTMVGEYEYLYSDDKGNLYNPNGNLVQYADGTMVGEDESTENDVVYTDEDGYSSEDEYTEDDYSDEDYYYEDPLEVRKGGLIHMQDGGNTEGEGEGGEEDDGDPVAEKKNEDGTVTQSFSDGSYIIFDAEGNVVRVTDANGEVVAQNDAPERPPSIFFDSKGNPESIIDTVKRFGSFPVTGAGDTPPSGGGTKSAIDNLIAGLNTYGGAGAAGAVLGALLSDSSLFGSGGGGGHSFDMTGVGAIDPRTTDFGIGPANYVGYDQYGTPEQMPELYGTELYRNLNAPGFNEVNPGDYARYDAEEFGEPVSEDVAQVEGMADGGQPQGGLGQTTPQTYYTFGKPVDALQNLRNPTPFQQQQPPMQSQMPPQTAQNAQMPVQQTMPQMAPAQPFMPQGAPPAGMRRGGLPSMSNVPITQGRLDFRRGSAVHGAGDGQSDDIPAMLADGEYVIDAETVAQIGNGSTKAGAQALDKFRENIRMHKRSAPVNKIPPKTKALTSYLKGAK